jgi:carbon storage regulator
MLILTRRIGEAIMIGDNVVVKVMGVRRGQIKIGIEAPRDVSVFREEIHERMQREYEGLERAADQSA